MRSRPAGDLVRLDLHDVLVGIAVDLQHDARLRAVLLQLLHRHVDQRAALDLPAAVGRGVHHVQLLAGDLVQQLLRPQQVLHQADRSAVAEVREVRDDREVLVGAPLVMQHHVVGHHDPADALHQLGHHREAELLHEPCDAIAIEVRRDGPHVPVDAHEVLLLVELAVLALDHADGAAHVGLVVQRGVRGRGRAEAVAVVVVDGVVAVGQRGRVTPAQQLRVLLVVQDRDVVGGEPLGGHHLLPRVRVHLLAVGVGDDVLGVERRELDLALHLLVEADARVQEAARGDRTVGEDVRALPVKLVGVGDLLEHLGHDLRQARRCAVARAEADLRAVVDLLAHHVGQGGDDLVDRERRAALQLEHALVVRVPLVASEEALAQVRLLDELLVAVVTRERVAHPDFEGLLGVDGHLQAPSSTVMSTPVSTRATAATA
jgi:hypothetical protein